MYLSTYSLTSSPCISEHKMMKCALCGFSTVERAQFRRHRRLHQRSNPTSTLHCDKCPFSTLVPRKMRDHYSRTHNADLGTSFIAASMHMRATSSTFNGNPGFNRLTAAGCHADGGYFVDVGGGGPPTLQAYRLSQPRGLLQFEPGDPSVLAGCGGGAAGGFALPAGLAGFRYDAVGRRLVLPAPAEQQQQQHQAPSSDRLGSSVLAPGVVHHHHHGNHHPRVPATSTITSCEYPARPANPHRPDLNNFSPLRGVVGSCFRDPFTWQPITSSPSRCRPAASTTPHGGGGEGGKVKTEPLDCDGVSDVSSSGVPGLFERVGGGPTTSQDRDHPPPHHYQRYSEPQTTTGTQPRFPRLAYEPSASSRSMEQSNEIAPSGADASRVSQSSEDAPQAESAEEGGERRGSGGGGEEEDGGGGDGSRHHHHHHHLLYGIKSETSSVAVQCPGSSSAMKSESVPVVTVAAAEHSTECRRGGGHYSARVERGVQCELLSSSTSSSHHRRRLASRALSTDSEQQSVIGSDTRCSHCGITFDDEVLFSIHIGCHSHTDPFVCNVCGKKCHNKYGFYSHIMRGHHF